MLLLILFAIFVLLCLYVISVLYGRSRQVDDIVHKCVFITGCDSGFGRCAALRLDAKGVPVFAGCLTDDGERGIRSVSSSLLQVVRIDVRSTESIVAAYEYIRTHLPPKCVLWGLVNNAGIGACGGPVEFHTRQDYQTVFDVNFFGLVEVTRVFLPLLKASRGRIVNTSSILGLVAMPTLPAYSAAKWAVAGWSEALRREKKPWGIGVSTVCPGGFNTHILDIEVRRQRRQRQWDVLPEDIKQEYGQDYTDRVMRFFERFTAQHKHHHPDQVAAVYEHALFSACAKDVYAVGVDARVMDLLNRLSRGLMDCYVALMMKDHAPAALR